MGAMWVASVPATSKQFTPLHVLPIPLFSGGEQAQSLFTPYSKTLGFGLKPLLMLSKEMFQVGLFFLDVI